MFSFMFQPLEQFEIVFFNNPLFTNGLLYVLIVLFSLYFLFIYSVPVMRIIPTKFQVILELSYKFIMGMVRQQVGLKGRKFLPLIFTLFFFILISNLVGMCFYSLTLTSYILKTFALSFSIFVGLIILGFVYQKLSFLNLFWPTGVPAALIPLLVVIEVISYFARLFSLAIRLFANMMAGHTLLNILSSFAVKLSYKKFLFAVIPFIIIFAVTGLEFGIAFVQAFVFTILICIYLNESLYPKAH